MLALPLLKLLSLFVVYCKHYQLVLITVVSFSLSAQPPSGNCGLYSGLPQHLARHSGVSHLFSCKDHRANHAILIDLFFLVPNDHQLRESGELVKVRSSNIVPLAAPDDWDPEDMDDTSLSSSSPAVSFSMADALPAVPLALHHPGFDANVSAAAPVVPPPVTYGGELPTFQLQDAQQGHAASPIQQQHLPWQKTNGDVGLSTAS